MESCSSDPTAAAVVQGHSNSSPQLSPLPREPPVQAVPETGCCLLWAPSPHQPAIENQASPSWLSDHSKSGLGKGSEHWGCL